jgi:hypothetical protein
LVDEAAEHGGVERLRLLLLRLGQATLPLDRFSVHSLVHPAFAARNSGNENADAP